MNVLERILETKRREVARLCDATVRNALEERACQAGPVRGFAAALARAEPPAVIAEFKRGSPSKGAIREGADPTHIAKLYADAGAAAMSVLTDRDFFSGCLRDLEAARAAVDLPVLRKDFTIDPIQIVEARAAGADAILLIVAALDDRALQELLEVAAAYGLDALVEVHTRAELERARAVGATLIGINNRDLTRFVTDVEVTRALLPHAGDALVVSESGLDDPAVLRALAEEGVGAFLVGEALMRAPDPAAALRRLRGAA